MIPVTTVEEMRAVDAAAPEPVELLVERAGSAVARSALRMLGGAYGRRVVVVAGKGNNGADGRVAADRLRRRGVRVQVLDAATAPATLSACDLVVDAAYGTGFRGSYRAPDPGSAPVLSVDIPSGVDGDTGEADGGAVRATRTVTFAALKPGLLMGRGAELAGEVEVADIGLDASHVRTWVVEPSDVGSPGRPRAAHKWQAAVQVVAGSPGMVGAAVLTTRGALRAGASSVRLAVPGIEAADLPLGEHVGVALPAQGWSTAAAVDASRFGAIVVGPGLGRDEATGGEVRALIEQVPVPVVADADALVALVGCRPIPGDVVLTPHDGELARLTGRPVPADRIAEVRALAAATRSVVLLKGPATIVGTPDGRVLIARSGTPALATAGTGDVLSGVIAAFLAMGAPLLEAAAHAAVVHGAAAAAGPRWGLLAGDLPDLVAAWLAGRRP